MSLYVVILAIASNGSGSRCIPLRLTLHILIPPGLKPFFFKREYPIRGSEVKKSKERDILKLES
jgi:hypothetical protein